MELTKEQQAIINNCDENLFINAGPGSGKSSILSEIAEKILDKPQNHIYLITFTNKAAKSIISKCSKLEQSRIIGGTFHGIAYKILRNNKLSYSICDENKKRSIIRKIFRLRKDKEKLEEIFNSISKAKSKWPYIKDLHCQIYQEELEKYNLLDFDDIIYKFIELIPRQTLRVAPGSHVLVDELQDTSAPQLEFLRALKRRLGDCKMIGAADMDQAIFAFRNARPENVTDFIKEFQCTVKNMGYNFRSGKSIIDISTKLISNNTKRIPKIITPARDIKGKVEIKQCIDKEHEIRYIISLCKKHKGTPIAILYRNRVYKFYLEMELKKAGIDYNVNDVYELSDRSSVRSMFCSLRVSSRVFDIYDLEQASKALSGIGLGTVHSLEKYTKNKTLCEVINDEISKNNKRLNSIKDIFSYFDANQNKPLIDLVKYIETKFSMSFIYQDDMKRFIHDIVEGYKISKDDIIELYNELGLDGKEEKSNKNALVELSTTHAYKGGQCETVILPWCQLYEPRDISETEEERRLFYVALTRAKDNLYISYSGPKPRFISELEDKDD